jgi:hypothetical protein
MDITGAFWLTFSTALVAFGQAQVSPTPPAAPQQLVQSVVTQELAAGAADHTHWLYQDADQTPKLRQVRWIAEADTADIARTLEENGKALPLAEQHKRVETYVRDKGSQAKERKKQQEDIKQTVDLLKLLPVAFEWTITGKSGDETTLQFKPDAKFHPPTAQARILAAVEGDLVINEAQLRILHLKGQLIHDVKFAGGLLGEIKAGGNFAIEHKEIAPGQWQIAETHVHLNGHLLLFKSVSEQEDDIKTNYKRLPDSLSLDQAAVTLF